MRRDLSLVVALASTMYGCDAEEAPERQAADAGDLADAGSMYDGLSCEQLVREVGKLPRECDEATPCTLVGTSCAPSWLFIAVNYSGWERATELHDAMRNSRCDTGGYDGWIPRAECRSGRCVPVDTDRSCIGSGNWGWDAGYRGLPADDAGATADGSAADRSAADSSTSTDGAP